MPSSPDSDYFARRAVQERRQAQRSSDVAARQAHAQLADLYEARAGRAAHIEHFLTMTVGHDGPVARPSKADAGRG